MSTETNTPRSTRGGGRRRGRRPWRWIGLAIAVVLLLGVAVRLALPSYLRDYVNRTIDQSPEYVGRVGAIDVHLWRGAYSIHDLKIVKRRGQIPVPFFEGRRVDISLYWGALLEGALRGKLVMLQPRLNFVHAPEPGEQQTGADQPWLAIIQDLYPFRIDRAEVIEGAVHFRAFHTEPAVDVYLSDVDAVLENLTNIEGSLDPLIATMRVRGVAMESGQLRMEMAFDPFSYRPRFAMAVRLLGLDVRELNSLARAYGDFDFEAGVFDLVIEASTLEGYVQGYAKPLFRNLKVITLRDVRTDDPLTLLWESLVGLVGAVFKNQARDQFGTRLSFEGDLDNPRTSILEIVGNVLRNAFVRAFLPRIEGRVAPRASGDPEMSEVEEELDLSRLRGPRFEWPDE